MANKPFELRLTSRDFTVLFLAILAGFLVYSSIVTITANLPDFLIPLIAGVFVGLLLKDWGKAAIVGFSVVFSGDILVRFLSSSSFFWGLPLGIVYILHGLIAALAGALSSMASKTKNIRQIIIILLFATIILNFVVGSTIFNTRLLRLVSQEPQAESYAFDGFFYLRIPYLLDRGMNYYDAFRKVVVEDARADTLPDQVQSYRLPTIFYLWTWLLPSNGVYRLYAFIFLSLIALVVSFFLLRGFTNDQFALLAPFLLAPYLLYGATSLWFVFLEYWGFFAALFSLFFFVRGKMELSGVFALIASLIRELFLFMVLAGLLASVFSRNRKRIALWLGCLLIFVICYFFHYLAVSPYVQRSALDLRTWFGGGPSYLIYVFSFGMDYFGLSALVRFLVFILALIGVLFALAGQRRVFLASVLLLPVVAFLMFGTGRWGGYWGATWMPFVLISVPLFFKAFLSSSQGS